MKKIYCFLGTSATGKSTLLNEIRKKYGDISSIELVPEGTEYACEQLNIKSMYELKDSKFFKIQEYIFSFHKTKLNNFMENEHKRIYISDRSMFDILFFCLKREKKIPKDFLDQVIHEAKSLISKLSLGFYFPIINVNIRDGFRVGNKYQYMLEDFALKGIVHDFRLPIVEMPKSSLEERLKFFEDKVL